MKEYWPTVKQGWGITLDEQRNLLYISDGTQTVVKADATTFREVGKMVVKAQNGKEINRINELEFIDGLIWANLFGGNVIVAIDPVTGVIQEGLDLKPLYDAEMRYVSDLMNGNTRNYDFGNNVLNGIAYDPATKDWYVTGKRWNLLFKLQKH